MITHGNEAGIPLTQQLMDPLCKFIQELLLEPLCLNGLNIWVIPKSVAFQCFTFLTSISVVILFLPFPLLYYLLISSPSSFPPFLCFLLFQIGSFSALPILLRHFCSHSSSPWFSTKRLYPSSQFQYYWIFHCSHLPRWVFPFSFSPHYNVPCVSWLCTW